MVSAHFGGEAIQRGETFEEWGMEGGATISVVVVSIDTLSDEGYRVLEPELREELEGVLGDEQLML